MGFIIYSGMKREILQKLELKELQHYRNTLLKRIEQLKQFNLQLARDNIAQTTRINQIKNQLYAKPPKRKSNKDEFNFDDIYKKGAAVVGRLVTRDGVTRMLAAGEDKIKRGLGFAGGIVRRVIGRKEDSPAEGQGAGYGDGEVVNEKADFNSYDIRAGKGFEKYEPRAESHLDQGGREGKYVRKKIFSRKSEEQQEQRGQEVPPDTQQDDEKHKQQQPVLKQATQQNQKQQPVQIEQVPQKIQQPQVMQKQQEKQQQPEDNNEASQPQSERQQKMDQKQPQAPKSKPEQAKATQVTQVEPNTIVDLQNDDQSSQQPRPQAELPPNQSPLPQK